MSFLHILIGSSLFLPFFLGWKLGKDFFGLDFPIFFGLCLQAFLGNFILIYAKSDESKDRLKVMIGYLLFFTGLSGSFLAGKSFGFLFFGKFQHWELFYFISDRDFMRKRLKVFWRYS